MAATADGSPDGEARRELGDAVHRHASMIEWLREARRDLDRRVQLQSCAGATTDAAALQQRRGVDRAGTHEDEVGTDEKALDRPVLTSALASRASDPATGALEANH